MSQTLRSLDLFSGCGGLAYGLSLAMSETGGKIVTAGAVDNWRISCETFQANLQVEPLCVDVSRATVAKLLDRIGDVDILTGGPPCQGFSTSGKRALDDPRNSLVRAYIEAVELAQPKAFVMENVSGFTTFQDGRVFAEVVSAARVLGYKTYPGIVLASLAGVPQRRRRFILVGIKGGAFKFPGQAEVSEPSERLGLFEEFLADPDLVVNQNPRDGIEDWTFDDATSDLPAIEAGGKASQYLTEPKNAYQAWARKDSLGLTDHVAVRHRPYFVEMMKYIPAGRSAMDPDIRKLMPVELQPKSGFPNSYGRIRGDVPAPTITRNFTTPSSANCIHPRQNRALSIREGARCQSFPDHFEFRGTIDEKRLMIGNAVPPLLGRALGVSLLQSLEEAAAAA
jgi:DNA (cytosine-5)-methyltransferase 1